MNKNFNQEIGFTLLEVMIVLAVIGIISTAIYNVHLIGWKTWDFNQKRSTLQQSGRIIMLKLEKEIKKAIDFKIQNSKQELIIAKDDELDNGKNDYVKYSIAKANKNDNNYTLYYAKGSGTDFSSINWGTSQPFTTAIIDSIKFTGANKLITMELILKDEEEEQSYSLRSRVYLKNSK